MICGGVGWGGGGYYGSWYGYALVSISCLCDTRFSLVESSRYRDINVVLYSSHLRNYYFLSGGFVSAAGFICSKTPIHANS